MLKTVAFLLSAVALIECASIGARLKRADCADNHSMCPTWATSGECAKNAKYMLANCQKSCGHCGDCVDNNNDCPAWAASGECQRNANWMSANCRLSCQVCSGSSGTLSSSFAAPVSKGRVNAVNEASGLAASVKHPGYLYTMNDSGGRNRVFMVNANNGRSAGTLTINGAEAIDWEDLAVGPCGDTKEWCLFVADTGGNSGRIAKKVYKLREPSRIGDQVINVVSIFRYDWNEPDCESVMVGPDSQVYLISKVQPGGKPGLYALPSWGWGRSDHVWLNRVATIPITSHVINPVAADVSHSGKEILIKAYDHVYYWQVKDGDSIATTLSRKYLKELPISRAEKQGESICWNLNDNGYFTLSEGYNQDLYFFGRQ